MFVCFLDEVVPVPGHERWAVAGGATFFGTITWVIFIFVRGPMLQTCSEAAWFMNGVQVLGFCGMVFYFVWRLERTILKASKQCKNLREKQEVKFSHFDEVVIASELQHRLMRARLNAEKDIGSGRLSPCNEKQNKRLSFMVNLHEKLQKTTRAFAWRKQKQLFFALLVIFVGALCFWSLMTFVAWFAESAHSPFLRLLQGFAFQFMVLFYTQVATFFAEKCDVLQIKTYTPGTKTKQHMHNVDNYSLWRLAHRTGLWFVGFKRVFYVTLFSEVTGWGEFMATLAASIFATVMISVVVTHEKYHYGVLKLGLERRSYASMADEHVFMNTANMFFIGASSLMFTLYFIVAKLEYNQSVYPFRQHAAKQWYILVFVWAYTAAALLATVIVSLYFRRKFTGKEFDKTEGKTHLRKEWEHLFTHGDKRLYIASLFIITHALSDPYYTFTVFNLSRQRPCSAAVNDTASISYGL